MSTPRRSGRTDGCWTCKLRRKKCDQLRPICGNCDSLEIACNYGPKPNWMTGRSQQRQMTESIKNEIKRNAAYRRAKVSTHQFNDNSNMIVSNGLLSIEPMDSATSGNQTLTPESYSAASHGCTPLELLPSDHQQHRCSSGADGVEQTTAFERDFIMKYLDFVFPALFPFYRPALFETGRSWLLLLLGKSKIAYHSIVSLSCYFFTMALTDIESGEEHADCKQLRWEEVGQQTHKCFNSIKKDMSALDLTSKDPLATKLERVEIMESVIQVLIFELALGKSAPWNSHLPAAYALFEEIMALSSLSYQHQTQSKLTSVLLDIGQPLWTRPGNGGQIWSPDQAGFRFCASFLIFIDVVASTAMQKTPKLLQYHSDVLDPIDEGSITVGDAEVRLSGIVGCRNWVIRSIAEISALDSWKREQVEANSLSVVELVDRASSIANGLRGGILEMQDCLITSSSSYLNLSGPFEVASPSASSKSTLIWAHAAQLYLTIVVSGWQLSNAEVRGNVACIIELLQTVSSHQLRALTWPLCVAGCLALESEESFFQALFLNRGRVCTAGALEDARQILQQVWQIRTTLDASTWNFASCFSILGSPVLLA